MKAIFFFFCYFNTGNSSFETFLFFSFFWNNVISAALSFVAISVSRPLHCIYYPRYPLLKTFVPSLFWNPFCTATESLCIPRRDPFFIYFIGISLHFTTATPLYEIMNFASLQFLSSNLLTSFYRLSLQTFLFKILPLC